MSERRPKKRPNVFANVVANADEVVQASFIASGPAPSAREAVSKGSTFAAANLDAAPAPLSGEPSTPTRPALPDQDAGQKPVPAPVVAAAPVVVEEPAAPPAPKPNPTAVEAPVVPSPQSTATTPELAPDPSPVASVTAQRASALAPAGGLLPPVQATPAAVKAPEARPAPAVEAAPKVAPRRRQPSVARRATGQTHWSHQAVLESFASATIQSRSWRLHGFRIVPEILTLLKTRINADRRTTGNPKLAISHYLDAALRHTPTDVDEQIALAQEFLTARMGIVEAGKQSTYRVGPEASSWVTDMNVGLQEADYGRKGIYVVSASIESFLGALDGGGALQRPELPGR